MLKSIILTVSFVLVLGRAIPAPAFGQSETLRLKQVDIMDPTGFKEPVRYAISVVPADWKTEGGIVWDVRPDSCSNGVNFGWTAQSPDEEILIVRPPGIGWQGTNITGWVRAPSCIAPDDYTPEGIARLYMKNIDVPYTITDIRLDPDIEQSWQNQLKSMSQLHGYAANELSGHVAIVEFTGDVEGVRYKGTLMLPIMSWFMGDQQFNTTFGRVMEPIMVASTEERHDEALKHLEVFVRNYREDPAWLRAKWQSDAEFRRNNPQRPTSTWKVDTTGSDILDIQMKGFRSRNAITDSGQANAVDGISGVTTYGADTPTGQVQIDTAYDNNWQLGDGTVVVSSDPFYDGTLEGGTKLEPER